MSIKGRTESGRVRTIAGTASLRRGSYGKNIIKLVFKNGREYQFHATKGWRSYRLIK